MSRKRSLKERYFRFLRRIWPAPTLAAIMLSLGACASQPVTSAAQVPTAPAAVMHSDELHYDWEPQLLPTEDVGMRPSTVVVARTGCGRV